MKPEDIIQSDIVLWFSQTYPDYYGCLWGVFNEDSKHKKALGMHRGSSDLQGLIDGIFIGIEVKAPNSKHKISHIKPQIEWGRNIVAHGGNYIMSSDIDEIKESIRKIISGQSCRSTTIEEVEKKIKESKFKHIEF